MEKIRKFGLTFAALFLFIGCTKHQEPAPEVISLQIIDRNGIAETISSKERLMSYQKVDFLMPQPYKKVLRVFGNDKKSNGISKITCYHSNGFPQSYLEAANGRANGEYKEWHPNGKLKMLATVMEGIADISIDAQKTWLFDKEALVWDEEGNLSAKIWYDKGELHGDSLYFYPNGMIAKKIPHIHDRIDGTVFTFSNSGEILEKEEYQFGVKNGISERFFIPHFPYYSENYDQGHLIEGEYYDKDAVLLGLVRDGEGVRILFFEDGKKAFAEYKAGIQEGEITTFNEHNQLINRCYIQDWKKQREEWDYYPDGKETPKLLVNWLDDMIHGTIKSWYKNGNLESQREMSNNKREGMSLAWYLDGSLMLIEEYEDDLLMKGSYFKKGDSFPISVIENGRGTAMLYDSDGKFSKKANYFKGRPIEE